VSLEFWFSLLVLAGPPGPEKGPLKSGPQPDGKGAQFHPLYTHHVSGPGAGQSALVTYDLPTRPRPSVFVFTRSDGQPVIDLVRKLDSSTHKGKQEVELCHGCVSRVADSQHG
jgi:hypothetical protein